MSHLGGGFELLREASKVEDLKTSSSFRQAALETEASGGLMSPYSHYICAIYRETHVQQSHSYPFRPL